MNWCIDGHRISLGARIGAVTLHIDGQKIASVLDNVLAHYAIPWRDRAVELRRVRLLNEARTEIWVDGVCVPPSQLAPRHADEGARCAVHGTNATRLCAKCETKCCQACLSVDSVRCKSCLAADTAAHTKALTGLRKRSIGFLFVVAAIFCGAYFATHSPFFLKAGGGLLTMAVMYVGYAIFDEIRQKKQTSSELATLPLMMELEETVPQIVGRSCATCDQRIAVANDGHYCAECRTFRHTKCEDGHTCVPSAAGPDWWALRELAKTPAVVTAKDTLAALKKAS